MKNRVIKITTKVAAAMAVASVIMGTASVTARAEDEFDYDGYCDEEYCDDDYNDCFNDACNENVEDSINDCSSNCCNSGDNEVTNVNSNESSNEYTYEIPVTGEEVAPAILRTELELEYSPTIEDEKYDPVISGVAVAPAPMRTELELEFNEIADPSIEYSVSTGIAVAPPVFRPEPESEYAAMLEKEKMKDDSIIRGEEVSQALARTSDGEVVLPDTAENKQEAVEEPKPQEPKKEEPVIESVDGCRTYTSRYRKVTNEEFERGEYDRILNYQYTADQYEIQEGKYYRLRMEVPTHWWHPLSRFYNRKIESDSIVKVLKVYEDPKWYGSERTIEYMDLATGKVGKATPNATLGGYGDRPLFYEIFSVEKLVERRRGLEW